MSNFGYVKERARQKFLPLTPPPPFCLHVSKSPFLDAELGILIQGSKIHYFLLGVMPRTQSVFVDSLGEIPYCERHF